jgi:hypothetical protein
MSRQRKPVAIWRAAVVALLAVASVVLPPRTALALGSDSGVVAARLGISAGDATDAAELGTTGDALNRMIPVLWSTAEQLGVSVESASVGQGFWSEDGELESEKDLDLLVMGPRDAIERLARTLGQAWDQSTVFIWYPQAASGEQATATIPLPGGAAQLTDEIYQAIAPEITDGGHVRYAGPESLLFIAKTNDVESDAAFYARMGRLIRILNDHGIETGPLQQGSADVTVVTRDDYLERSSELLHEAA